MDNPADATTFLLIRHGTNDWIGKGIAGRTEGVHLNELGRQQAAALVPFLASTRIDRIVSSPLDRARETAMPLATMRRLPIEISQEVLEIDFGDWNGVSLAEISADPIWESWNAFRASARLPNGESMLDAQVRMRDFVEQQRERSPGKTIAVFSHGDPIRSVLLLYLGMPIDFANRLEISPGSVSIVRFTSSGPELAGLNLLPALG